MECMPGEAYEKILFSVTVIFHKNNADPFCGTAISR